MALGFKVKYHKSEVYVFDKTDEEMTRIINMLNFKLG
jgi:hypothetical protein